MNLHLMVRLYSHFENFRETSRVDEKGSTEITLICRGSLNGTHFGEFKHCKCIGNNQGFHCESALFGLKVSSLL